MGGIGGADGGPPTHAIHQSLLQRHPGLPAQQRSRSGDVRLALLRVVLRLGARPGQACPPRGSSGLSTSHTNARSTSAASGLAHHCFELRTPCWMARELLLRLGHQGLKLGRTGIDRTEIDRQTRQTHPRLPPTCVVNLPAASIEAISERAICFGLHLQPGALESAAADAARHASSRASSTDRARRVGKAEEETRSGGRRRAGGPPSLPLRHRRARRCDARGAGGNYPRGFHHHRRGEALDPGNARQSTALSTTLGKRGDEADPPLAQAGRALATAPARRAR